MRNNERKFALICFTINCVIFKLFIGFPNQLVYEVGSGSVISLWLCSLFSIIVLLVGYFYIRKYKINLINKSTLKIISVIAFAYCLSISIYTIYKLISILKLLEYPNTPLWIILILIVITIFIVGSKDQNSIVRLHGLTVPIIFLGLIFIGYNGGKYIDVYNQTPILGSNIYTDLSASFKHMFSYSEIIVPILFLILSQKTDDENITSNVNKPMFTILISAISGIIIYSVFSTIFYFSAPVSITSSLDNPMFYLSKLSITGKINTRLDAINTIITIVSILLLLSSIVYIILQSVKRIGFIKKSHTNILSIIMVIIICVIPLCSCYDNNDVEDMAFAIALGVDVGENSKYSYTLQLTNPLETGANTNSAESNQINNLEISGTAENNSGHNNENNRTVNNLKIDADNIFEAMEKTNNYISKKISLAHIKLLVLSNEVAVNGNVKEICQELSDNKDVRPETNICITDGITSWEYLISVNPSLESNNARYYELLFNDKSTFETVQTHLRSFNIKLNDDCDAYAPLISNDGFKGTVIFSGSKAVATLNTNESRFLNLLLGNIKNSATSYTHEDGTVYNLSQNNKSKLIINLEDNNDVNVIVKSSIDIKPKTPRKNASLTSTSIDNNLNSLITKMYNSNSDILGVQKKLKSKFLYDQNWLELKYKIKPSNFIFKLNTNVNLYFN